MNDRAYGLRSAESRCGAARATTRSAPTASARAGEAYGETGNDTLFAGGHGGQIADGGSGDDTINSGGF